MAEGGTVVVDVEPRLDKNKAKRGFSSFAKVAAGVFAGVFAAKFALDFGKDLIKQAEEYNSLVAGVGNLVANQQKALGEEASLTTESIVEQAKALQRLTGFSDELILSGQRQLLSFQNIQNAGEGTDAIYDRTTAALTDLIASGALTDFNSGAIQLGKALNDPIKGVTALGRAGIQFTDTQKETIKTLVEGNDILGAQKLVLDELESVYGGTAESQRDATAVIANAWQDLKVKAGQVLLPIVERIATFLVDKAIPAFEEWWPAIKEAGQALGTFFAAGWQAVQPVLETVWSILQQVFGWISGTLVPFLRDVFWPAAVEVWDAIGVAVGEAWDVIEPILEDLQGVYEGIAQTIEDTIMPALQNWSSENSETVEGLVADFQLGWATIKPILINFGDQVAQSFQRGEDGMSDFERGARFLFESIEPALIQLGAIFVKVGEVIVTAVTTTVGVVVGVWNVFGDDIIAIVSNAWGTITGIVSGAFDILEGLLDIFVGIFTLDWDRVWAGAEQVVGGAWQVITETVTGAITELGIIIMALPNQILEWIGDLGGTLFQSGLDLIAGFGRGIREAAGGLLTTIREAITNKIPGWIKGPLGISSPSKVTMEFGRNVSEGLAVGISQGATDVQKATARMIPTIAGNAAAAAAAGATPASGGDTNITVVNPTNKTTNSGIQKGAALGRLVGS